MSVKQSRSLTNTSDHPGSKSDQVDHDIECESAITEYSDSHSPIISDNCE